MMVEQLVLDLGHRPALGHEDFLVAPCNSEAVAWLDRWPDWPEHALAVHGPVGCGKSHLAHVWRARSGAALIEGASLRGDDVPRLVPESCALIVEDGDAGVDEEALFHLHNMLAERGGYLLLTGRRAPSRWPVGLADLRSRLKAVPAVAIGLPDDALLAAVLVKMFGDRQLGVSAGLVNYLVGRIERSFEGARAVVEALDRAALAGRRRLTVRLAQQVLASLEGQ